MKQISMTTVLTSLAIAAGMVGSASATTLVTDDFSTPTSANYTTLIAGEASATFNYDYTADQTGQTAIAPFAIPTAPGASGKTALRLEANPTSGVRSGVTVFSNTSVPPGTNFKVTAYVFPRINPDGTGYTGGSGSSQCWLIGINGDGTKVLSEQEGLGNLPTGLTGYFFGAVGDVGFGNPASTTSQGNVFLVKGLSTVAADPASQAVTWTYSNASPDKLGGLHGAGGFEAILSPGLGYNYYGGGGQGTGDNWTKVEMTWDASTTTLEVALNGTIVANYVDASSPFNSGGKVGLGLYDPTNSAAGGVGLGYTLFDSFTVDTIPSAVANWTVY